VQELVADGKLMDIHGEQLSATPIDCGTLLFELGSEQDAHFDTFYMPSETPNKMCATWIAIDQVTETNGPLIYYPKSHLIEPFMFATGKISANPMEMPAATAHIKRIIDEYKLEEHRFYPKPGDVLIWHAQLLHGGSPILDLHETRTSLVTHYWTTLDCSNPADWVVLGEGRRMLRRPYHSAISKAQRTAIDDFVNRLTTPPEHLVDLPPGFDPRGYLLRNPDVYHGGADPYTHYFLWGRSEGRSW
jgi:hypothetical protein